MNMVFRVFVVLCVIKVSIVSSLHSPKSCAEFAISPMQGFVKELYVGDWFIHQQYDFGGGNWFLNIPYAFPGSAEYDCFVLLRTPRPDGKMNATEILVKPDVLRLFKADGLATFNRPGKGSYIYSSKDIPKYNGEYIILKTDYLTYSIECKCTDVSGGSIVEFYVFSRIPTVLPNTQNDIDEVTIAHHFNDHEIRTLNITSCPAQLKKSIETSRMKLVTTLLRGGSGGLLGVLPGLLGTLG